MVDRKTSTSFASAMVSVDFLSFMIEGICLSSCLPPFSLLEGGNMFKKREIRRADMMRCSLSLLSSTLPHLLIWSKIVVKSIIFCFYTRVRTKKTPANVAIINSNLINFQRCNINKGFY